ncbi:unnamed protein product, partial [Ectocarpus fasciculatus]
SSATTLASIRSIHLHHGLHLPRPSTAPRTFLRLIGSLSCCCCCCRGLHCQPHPVRVGTAKDQEAPATPGPVLRSTCQQLENALKSRAKCFKSFSGASYHHGGDGLSLCVHGCFVRTPSQQQVRGVMAAAETRCVQRGLSAVVLRVDVGSQLQESQHGCIRATYCCEMEWGKSRTIPTFDIGSGFEKRWDGSRVVLLRCEVQHTLGVGISAYSQKHFHGGNVVPFQRQTQRTTSSGVDAIQVNPLLDQCQHHLI